MNSNIRDIINNKLHNFKYLNFTIAFYIIFFYTYYSLFAYLLDKNYIMLLLYFIFFILFYSVHKNFTYFIGFIILITFKIFNIDIIINSHSINLINKFNPNKIENLDVMRRVQEKADDKEKELKDDQEKNKPSPNPCKSYIINKVQEAGIKISNSTFNYESKKDSTESAIEEILSGMDDLGPPPPFYRLA
jgi:hypothetical protein